VPSVHSSCSLYSARNACSALGRRSGRSFGIPDIVGAAVVCSAAACTWRQVQRAHKAQRVHSTVRAPCIMCARWSLWIRCRLRGRRNWEGARTRRGGSDVCSEERACGVARRAQRANARAITACGGHNSYDFLGGGHSVYSFRKSRGVCAMGSSTRSPAACGGRRVCVLGAAYAARAFCCSVYSVRGVVCVCIVHFRVQRTQHSPQRVQCERRVRGVESALEDNGRVVRSARARLVLTACKSGSACAVCTSGTIRALDYGRGRI
jgi:hypothetical protein